MVDSIRVLSTGGKGFTAFSASAGALVNLKELTPQTSPIATPDATNAKLAPWGADNLFPQNLLKEIRTNTVIGAALDWKSRALYGNGLRWGYETTDSSGNIIRTPKADPVVKAWMRRSNINRYLLEASKDLYYFYNVFPELIRSKDYKQIVSIGVQDAVFCRWSKQNTNGIIEKCLIHGDWSKNKADEAEEIAVIDPYYSAVQSTLENTRDAKLIYPLSIPTPGQVYYQLADWNSLRTSGWLAVAAAIPGFKKAIFENQISLKYHIEIAEWYWLELYPNWATDSTEVKDTAIKEYIDGFEKTMAGSSNGYKSLMSMKRTNPVTGKEESAWTVKAIDDKLPSGVYIEDSAEASSHLLFALGVDPTLIGLTPSGRPGNGSGSENRVAFNTYISMCQAHRDIVLEPIRLIQEYNGWDPELEFWFEYPTITTLDKGKETQQQTS